AYRGPGLLIDMPEPMVTDFSRDITEGIAGTGVKAAFLKFALETPEPSPGIERIARAIARTHVETGAPITVHTSGPHQTGRLAVPPRRTGTTSTSPTMCCPPCWRRASPRSRST